MSANIRMRRIAPAYNRHALLAGAHLQCKSIHVRCKYGAWTRARRYTPPRPQSPRAFIRLITSADRPPRFREEVCVVQRER